MKSSFGYYNQHLTGPSGETAQATQYRKRQKLSKVNDAVWGFFFQGGGGGGGGGRRAAVNFAMYIPVSFRFQ